ncbi:hypothetical protein JQC92_03655 [Shewanella sp. 202IG2-18]|uniref:hypothetical protein n=1 Tax=Parashewanella hymeniacidonis TaxID=2807618 RepID=UPI00195F346B|nr:hypothetical protein [Parashewanella hymeniacidonis]MBM7071136.1 hypothetical protein [Parashewanella hymeniacidonis]
MGISLLAKTSVLDLNDTTIFDGSHEGASFTNEHLRFQARACTIATELTELHTSQVNEAPIADVSDYQVTASQQMEREVETIQTQCQAQLDKLALSLPRVLIEEVPESDISELFAELPELFSLPYTQEKTELIFFALSIKSGLNSLKSRLNHQDDLAGGIDNFKKHWLNSLQNN